MKNLLKLSALAFMMLCFVTANGVHAKKAKKTIRGKASKSATWSKVSKSNKKMKIGNAVIKGKRTDVFCNKSLSCQYTAPNGKTQTAQASKKKKKKKGGKLDIEIRIPTPFGPIVIIINKGGKGDDPGGDSGGGTIEDSKDPTPVNPK